VGAHCWSLFPRIRGLDELLAADPRLHRRVREVHPEVSFRAMNDGAALSYRKKSYGGVFERLELLRRNGIELGDVGMAACVPIDDVLDAAAAAWSGHRIASGIARCLPDPPEMLDGRPVGIWY
jgi:predicted RNase H-like nuclease